MITLIDVCRALDTREKANLKRMKVGDMFQRQAKPRWKHQEGEMRRKKRAALHDPCFVMECAISEVDGRLVSATEPRPRMKSRAVSRSISKSNPKSNGRKSHSQGVQTGIQEGAEDLASLLRAVSEKVTKISNDNAEQKYELERQRADVRSQGMQLGTLLSTMKVLNGNSVDVPTAQDESFRPVTREEAVSGSVDVSGVLFSQPMTRSQVQADGTVQHLPTVPPCFVQPTPSPFNHQFHPQTFGQPLAQPFMYPYPQPIPQPVMKPIVQPIFQHFVPAPTQQQLRPLQRTLNQPEMTALAPPRPRISPTSAVERRIACAT